MSSLKDDSAQNQFHAGAAETTSTGSESVSTVPSTPTASSTSTTESPSPITASPSSPNNSTSNGQVSVGAVAGAVVGTAVAVALLTFAITFLLAKRRFYRPRRSSPIPLGKVVSNSSDEGRRDPAYQWERHLPQSSDDQSVRLAVQTLLTQADQHVAYFYRDECEARGRVSPELEQAMLHVQSPHLPDQLPALMAQSREPTVLIKHCLVHLILDPETVLPPALTALPHSLAHARRSPDSVKGFPQLFSRWRVLTAYLQPPLSDDPEASEQRQHAVAVVASQFSAAFAPWEARYSEAERQSHLLALFDSAAEVALLLFQQPSTLVFDWKEEQPGGNAIMLPALVKTTDQNGSPLPEAKKVVEPAILARV